jgi:hypothetical protein
VVAIVPVPVVVRDAEGNGLVVAPAQVHQGLRGRCRVAPGLGFFDHLVRGAEDTDDVLGPDWKLRGRARQPACIS